MASRDEGARLGAGPQQGARLGSGPQQGALGGSNTPSKKKQKDRANQESREAKRVAAASVVIGGNGDAKKDVFVDWKQSASEVTVRLRCGEEVQRPSDVQTTFTDTHCHARFPDGCQWGCRLQEEIEASCSKVQYKEKGNFLLLVMHKKIPFHTWPSLMSSKKETVTTETKNGKEEAVGVKTEKAVRETTEKDKQPSSSLPPSSSSPLPAHLPRTKADRGVKRSMKPRLVGEAGGRQGEAGGRPAGRKEQVQEPSPKRTVKPGKTKETSAHTSHTHTSPADTHTSHTHTSPADTHTSHTHTSPADTHTSHTHTSLADTHTSHTHTSPADTHTSPADTHTSHTHTSPTDTHTSPADTHTSPADPHTSELRARNVDANISKSAANVTDGERLQAEASSNRSVSPADPAAGRLREAQPKLSTGAEGHSPLTPAPASAPSQAPASAQAPSLAPAPALAPASSLAPAPSLPPAPTLASASASSLAPAPSQAPAPASSPAWGPRPHGPEKEEEEKKDLSKEESVETQEGAPEPMVNLQLVKNDSYEKGTDLMVVNVYMKNICRESARVLFREQDFTLIFQTSDVNFLRLHPDCGINTVFKWQVKLRNLIQPEQCSYAFTPSRLDITLKKRHSQRWGGLEASSTQGAVGGAKVAVGSSPSTLENPPAGKGSPLSLPAQPEGPRLGEDQPPAPRAPEDGGLDMVGPRSVSEHPTLKQEAPVTMPKPTCMVQPMTHTPPMPGEPCEDEEERKVCLPGFTGLVNLGNTCFMNSVIQSLSNTRELRDYFHDRGFEREINCSNPLGTGGRLAIGFAVLLRALWKGTHHAFQPSRLKAIVASKASQFTGYAQHDAQEFMAFLLDGLHEDLNRIQNKPYTETVDSDGRLDEVVADEAWQRHKMRNDSFIVDLFQGQYKSKLVCPVCSKVSITFDPFLYLPVPLPQKQKVLTVFYFSKEPHKKPIKFLVSVSKENSSTAEVLEFISRSVRVKPENLRLAEVVRSRLQRVFLPSSSLDSLSSSDMLFCFEVLSKELAKERVLVLRVHQRPQVPSTPISKCAACLKPPASEEDKLKRCMRCYRVGYCNQVCQKNHWSNHKLMCRPNTESVGLPFLVSVPQSRLTYTRLAQLLEGFSRFSVNVFQPPFQSGRSSPEGSQSRSDLPPIPTGPTPGGLEAGEGAEEEAAEGAEGASQTQECSSSKSAQTSATPAGHTDSSFSSTCDSGFSEPPPPPSSSSSSSSSLEPQTEKETSCEKALRPEAAVAGYQQPLEAAAGYTSQFYISLLDANNKDVPLEEKGDAVLDLPDDSSVELVWKNNERVKEYVLVRSRELDYVDDPSSVSDTARAGHFTLGQCLSLFTKPEVLAPEEAWYCPKCQQHREASKQLLLWRLPNVLIIQLKRFSFRSFIWRDKINDMVDFPVRNLDLSKSCIGQKDDLQQQPVYDLYAVINHYGGMIGGHYTAYARLPSDKNSQRSDVGWRLFDDSTVTTVEESQVVTRYAYVLFYRRRNSPVERPPRPPGAEPPAATASQAALIWQEVEEEEEGPGRGLFSALRRRGARRREEERPRGAGPPQRAGAPQGAGAHRRAQHRISDYSDDDCVRYFVLGTLAALFALLLNLLFTLLGRQG